MRGSPEIAPWVYANLIMQKITLQIPTEERTIPLFQKDSHWGAKMAEK